MNVDKELKELVKIFIKNLILNNKEEIYLSYKELYAQGKDSLSMLIETVLAYDWSKIDNSNQIRVLSGVMSLINDIDEYSCKNTAKIIIDKGCARVVKQCLNSIVSFTLDDYATFKVYGIDIYIFNKLNNIEYIKDKIDKWLFIVPKDELEGIDRIYIIPNNKEYAYNGTYMPILSYIKLIWKNDFENSFLWKWIDLLRVQHTLYHEIGHHYHKHIFGEDKIQEKEANVYASRLMQKAYPRLTKLIRLFK